MSCMCLSMHMSLAVGILPYNRLVNFLPSGVHVVTLSISATNKIPITVVVPFEIPTTGTGGYILCCCAVYVECKS